MDRSWGLKTDELQAKLAAAVATWPTRDILLWTLVESTWGNIVGAERADLTSPASQLRYLKGIISRVPYRGGVPVPWPKIVALLNAYFDAMYTAFKEEAERVLVPNDAIVATGAFLKEFYHRRYWSEAEAAAEADKLFSHFSPLVSADLGCSPGRLIEVGLWLSRELRRRADEIPRKLSALKSRAETEVRIATSWPGGGEEARAIAIKLQRAEEEIIYGVRLVIADEVECAAPGIGRALLHRLSVRRPVTDGAALTLADSNPVDEAPFVEVEPNVYFAPNMTDYWGGIVRLMERAAVRGSNSEVYFHMRSERLEERARLALQLLFGPHARVLPGNPTLLDGVRNPKQDVVVLWRDLLIIAECKSSRHPFARTKPAAASDLISEWFASDKGVRGGITQCNRIREAAALGPVRFAINGGKIVEVPVPADSVHGICVLSESVGILSVQPAWALEGIAPEETPLVIGIADLEAAARGFEYFGDGPEDFVRYLDERRLVARSAFTFDELDIVAEFLRYRTIRHLSGDILVRLSLDSSDLFAEIEAARLGGPTAVRPPPGTPPPTPTKVAADQNWKAYRDKRRKFRHG